MKKDYSSLPPIGIIAYSDFYDIPDRRVWGDYWLKENLIKEFIHLGYPVDQVHPQIVLHLFGEPVNPMPSGTYNILWIHSHPDWITPEILVQYQKIYCISEYFTNKTIKKGFDVETLMVPTHMTPLNMKKIHDIVFVGNTKKNQVRKIIQDMGNTPYAIKVWGWGWEGLIPDAWYGGSYYEHERLNELYASAKIVLNDHHEDMRREGFVNPRILDALASGSFVVSDSVLGMDQLFDNSVVTYSTAEELHGIVDRYIRDETDRQAVSEKGAKIALRYTYSKACAEIIRHIESNIYRI